MDFTKLVFIIGFILMSSSARSSGDLIQSRNEVMKLGARLNSLERELGQNNNKYLSSIEKIRLIETDIVNYQDRLQQVKAEVNRSEGAQLAEINSHVIKLENRAGLNLRFWCV